MEIVFLILFGMALYTIFLFFICDFIFMRENKKMVEKVKIYKQNMLYAQNTAKQYKQNAKKSKKGLKKLKKKYSELEIRNKCLEKIVCEKAQQSREISAEEMLKGYINEE